MLEKSENFGFGVRKSVKPASGASGLQSLFEGRLYKEIVRTNNADKRKWSAEVKYLQDLIR